MITSLHGAPSHWQHASNTTCPSSSPVPNQVTLSKRTMSLAISFLFLADASMPDITPSRLFGPSQTRTERTGNNVGGSFCSVETPLVSTRALSSQSVRSLTSIRVVGVGTHLLRRIASDSGAADQVLARSTIESYVTRDPLREYTPTGLDRSVGTCGSCPQRSYKRGGGHPASIQLFAFRSVWFDAMEGAPKAKTVPTLPTLDQAHLEELSASIRGEVFRRGDQRSARTHARRQHFPLTLPYLVFTSRLACSMETLSTPQGPSYCPLTHGMSHSKHCRFLLYFLPTHMHLRVVLFCNKHELSPSVKAGGYGTGGWAINGDIVIDLSRIQEMDIEPPQPGGGGYTSLRDIVQSADKGKARVGQPVLDLSGPATKKRALETEAEDASTSGIPPSAWLYSTASAAVASFLHGPELPPDDSGEEPRRPANYRRRLDIDGSALSISTNSLAAGSLTAHSNPISSSSGSDTRSSTRSAETATTPPTNTTTPASSRSPHSDSAIPPAPPAPFTWAEPFDLAPSRPDPFAYIDNIDPPMFGASPPTPLSSSAAAWGADSALLAHPLFAGDIPSHLTRPVPPHTHAYVSFGAGARQKDVDTFTASHLLDGGVVPYHVPLCVQLPLHFLDFVTYSALGLDSSAHPVGASVMLLGGFGFLSRLHGLSIDNLVEAEVVLADGRIVIVNEKEHEGERPVPIHRLAIMYL